jgi:hypothetical protein
MYDGLPQKCQLAMEREYPSLTKVHLKIENLALSDQQPVL